MKVYDWKQTNEKLKEMVTNCDFNNRTVAGHNYVHFDYLKFSFEFRSTNNPSSCFSPHPPPLFPPVFLLNEIIIFDLLNKKILNKIKINDWAARVTLCPKKILWLDYDHVWHDLAYSDQILCFQTKTNLPGASILKKNCQYCRLQYK